MSHMDIDSQVADVARAWETSTYYEDAERWTHKFWGKETPFNKYFQLLDLTRVVDLACGHGRHTEQIVHSAKHIIMIDVFDTNLDQCRKRLGVNSNVDFLKGNGRDFTPLADASVSALFCFDAMVHFTPDIVKSYIFDTARILAPGGMALLHHSNYGEAPERHYGQNPHARNHMTTELFASYVGQSGLYLAKQEIMDWGTYPNLDTLSLLGKPPLL